MSKIRPFARQGNFTVVNNFVIDHIMPNVSPTAFKILMFAIRKTVGWHKESDRISYSQFRGGCGIKSDHTISRALSELMDKGYLLRWQTGTHERTKKPLYSYGLNTDYEVDTITVKNTEMGNVITVKNAEMDAASNTAKSAVTKDIKKHQTNDDDGDTRLLLTPAFNPMITNILVEFGIAQSVARVLSEDTTLEIAEDWIEYALNHTDIRNPQAFVVSRLKLGERPPHSMHADKNESHRVSVAASWAAFAQT